MRRYRTGAAASLLAALLVTRAVAQGASLASVTFTPGAVPGGKPATAVITLTAPAPGGGFAVALTMTSNVAQLSTTSVTVGAGLTTAQVSVTTTPTATAQTATLTATARNDTRTGSLIVNAPSVQSLSVQPTTVTSGQSATFSVTLDGAAPPGGTALTLSRDNPAVTVPATSTVAAGQTTTTFTVTTGAVTTQTAVSVSAAAGGVARSATLTVRVPPIGISSLKVSCHPCKSGSTIALTVTLNQPSSGIGVQLASTLPLFSVELEDLLIPATATSATRLLHPPATSVDLPFTITATPRTTNPTPFTFSDTLYGPRMTSFYLNDTTVQSGKFAEGLVILDANAKYTQTVPLSFSPSNSAIRRVTHEDASNDNWSKVYVFADTVTKRTSVTISATLYATTKQVTIVVLPPAPGLRSFAIAPSSVRVGGTVDLTAALNVPAPAGGAIVQLTAGALPAGYSVPSQIVIPQGATTATIPLTAPRLISAPTTIGITASYGGVSKTAAFTVSIF